LSNNKKGGNQVENMQTEEVTHDVLGNYAKVANPETMASILDSDRYCCDISPVPLQNSSQASGNSQGNTSFFSAY
jgi:hypothetical protein